jgi:hypothetical protein
MSNLPLIATLLLTASEVQAPAQQEPPFYDLAEELRIVSNESSPATSLSTISALTVLSDGGIVTVHGDRVDLRHSGYGIVGDGTTPELLLRIYDANGQFLRAIGAKGAGPGEFRAMAQAGSVGDDVWVTDYYTDRHTVLSRDGKPISIQRVRSATMLAILPGGRRFVRAFFSNPSEPLDLQLGGRPLDSLAYSVEDSTGAKVTSVVAIPSSGHHRFGTRAENRMMIFEQELDGSDIPLISPGATHFGVLSDASQWGGRPGQVRLYHGGSDGRITTQEISFPPRRVPSNYIDSIVNSRYASASAALKAQVRNVLREKLHVPGYYPVLAAALIGRDGALWIQPMYEPGIWHVAIGGRRTMRVRVPSGTNVMAVSRAKVWAVRKDANDLPIVLRYRLVPAR